VISAIGGLHSDILSVMTRLIRVIVLVFPMVLPVFGQETDGPPSAEFVRRANQWMVSSEAGKRKASYLSWKQMGPEALPEYQKGLEAARKHHSKVLEEVARGRASITNPYAAHHTLAVELDDERVRVMALIRTDWQKDGTKVKMLRTEMEGLEKLWERVNRLAAADTTKFDALVDGAVEGLAEVARELEAFDADLETVAVEDEDLRAYLMRDNLEGEHLMRQRQRFALTLDEVAVHAAAEKAHAGLEKWASATMKEFANLLNRERVIAGLPPLIMEEKLSDACLGHSLDMARLGFFAHESPVPGKKSPWDRAKLAGFEGSGSGENIFMGSTSHSAAYHAWFASDGHRFIMFGGGNTLGVGIAGSHWTMMTGNLRR